MINLNINPYTFTGSAFFIGLILANELNTLEQATIGNWLQLAGMTIQTYASQVALVTASDSSNNQTSSNNQDDLNQIRKAISRIDEELNKIINNNKK